MKKFLVLVAALAAVVPATVALGGSGTDRVTGGGQVILGSRGGAGDTIAFTAQDTATNRGQVQYVDRNATGQTTYHGRVACVEVSGNMAKIAGTWDKGKGTFEVLVVDNGQGSAADDDLVTVQPNDTSPQCDNDDDDDDTTTALARGNAQVYDAP